MQNVKLQGRKGPKNKCFTDDAMGPETQESYEGNVWLAPNQQGQPEYQECAIQGTCYLAPHPPLPGTRWD